MRILIIEDEPKMAAYLRKGLVEASFTVDTADNGVNGLFLALHEEFDLIVLDVMLPGIDGFELLRRLRKEKQTPVLLLTARDTVADKVEGLELGADDYLSKPFAYAEFLARIRSLLRRAPRAVKDVLRIADMEVDFIKRRVKRGDLRIDLTAQEFSLLQLLAERQGEVLTRTFITSQIWDMNFDSDTNVVDAAVKRLRAKIDNSFETKLLHTVRGMGYVLEDRS
ncbi:heavy metal response regulator transcription factor [Paraburkholderia sp. SIMBA_055]|jgi:two-component system, OmpR family, copper resistance phosphate regulon response regulator CusR|uniref:Two component heavy metal response transcriptional regulator, winged helix family n=2 Tax=Paraburkholderia graminis TaxID=60548 RepID=B1FSM4_PARG4|nr:MULTISPECIES: heavy metal response regulator transcription factor [Paraburkholderia]AXF10615.1 DNA-binding response regulator [Paraburkholderia graminis]EDT12766.1 two component heavy metal response transcriptional regulator, winged helix family [Paraburkholderia graminis C4D1M]MDQ0625114.1 two-component system copper resistance phosphate regulon response regulator CusR [Paraburkholderia graminis]MDR6206270.1 two-component system copper resistance phosphate regulon response regulator CusR [P